LDEMARIPYSEGLAICQSLKRSREEFEHLQDAGETQRQRPADYLGQRHDQPIPRGNLDQSLANIQSLDDQTWSIHYSLDGGVSKQEHVLRRKSALHFDEKEVMGTRRRISGPLANTAEEEMKL
jgi:hypothetical protein